MADQSVSLDQLLAGRLLIVPDYQRDYAWGPRQLEEFVEDLDLMGSDKELRRHYTGTVVLLEREGTERFSRRGASLREAEIVDGQQRLMTILLLLHHLANAIEKEDVDLGRGIREDYVLVPLEDRSVVPKIRLAGDADAFLRQYVLEERPAGPGPTKASHQRLQTASDYLRSFVETLAEAGQTELLSLHRRLTQLLRFNRYEVESASEAGVIFETVNARGKDLTELELVKNYLMFAANWIGGGLGRDLSQLVNEVWSSIYENLMTAGLTRAEDEEQLLRVHWHIDYDYSVRSFLGAKSVKSRFALRRFSADPEGLEAEISRFARSLRESSWAFCELKNPRMRQAFATYAPDQRARAQRAVEKLRRAGNAGVYYPLLVAARIQASAGEFVALVDLCERHSFRLYRVLRVRSDTGSSQLARIGFDPHHRTDTPADAMERLRGELHHQASTERVRAALTAIADWYSWSGLKYFLYEWEAFLTKNKPIVEEWGTIEQLPKQDTIEHILPQGEHGQWLVDFPDEREHEDLTHTLGNLMLTFDNSCYSNKEYDKKRGSELLPPGQCCYLRGRFEQERDLALRHATWTPEEVRERQNYLVDFALQRWGVELPTSPGAYMTAELEPDFDEEFVPD